ncbi:MAG: deoxyribose-phosphate aldolase [Burkholderiaceae bacterium]|nr:deoxyribose-phosphate aldolase [Burkholderiaceae bacterium]
MNGHPKRAALAAQIDHSVLKPEASAAQIIAGAQLVRAHAVGFYCVQPSRVALAARELAGSAARVVTVVGFPHGCDLGETKARAAALAVQQGAAEIDMVLDFGALLDGDTRVLAGEVGAVVRACAKVPLKVIVESALLDDAQLELACRISVDAGAAFVKTSTGFHPAGGASPHAVRLMRRVVGPSIGVKASGGIRTLDDTLAMLGAGANRIGTSGTEAILAALPD